MIKECLQCQSEFEYSLTRRALCSDECQRLWRDNRADRRLKTQWKIGDSRTCDECAETFIPTHGSMRICSDQCRNDREKRKGREYREANKDEINARARKLHWENREDRLEKARLRRTPEKQAELNR